MTNDPSLTPAARQRLGADLVQKISGGVTWVYGYDALNRLVSARRGGTVIARYAYDVEGRRIAKRVYSTASGGVVGYTRFVYRGAHVGFATDSAGTTGMKYVWGLNIDDLIAFEDGSGNHYYVAKDKVGSIRNVATRSGTWVMRLRHKPYGALIDSVGTGVMLRYRWTGREWDAELGWYFMRARHYDPVLSRFTQEDPIGFAGGDNLYAYVGGSPLEARDPNGLKSANLDTPFEGFCFSSGACVNWDGSLRPSASGWSTGGGGGWLSDSYLNQTRAEFEVRYEITILYEHYRQNYDELARQGTLGNLDPVVAELFRTGKPLEKGDWERFAKEASKVFVALGQLTALDITLSHLVTGRLAINDQWLNQVAKERAPRRRTVASLRFGAHLSRTSICVARASRTCCITRPFTPFLMAIIAASIARLIGPVASGRSLGTTLDAQRTEPEGGSNDKYAAVRCRSALSWLPRELASCGNCASALRVVHLG